MALPEKWEGGRHCPPLPQSLQPPAPTENSVWRPQTTLGAPLKVVAEYPRRPGAAAVARTQKRCRRNGQCRLLPDNLALRCSETNKSTCGLAAMTSASHAEGRQFDPGQVYPLKSLTASWLVLLRLS